MGLVSQYGRYTSLMKPMPNNLAIPFYYIFLVLNEMVESLVDGLGLRVHV
jgi:hypothetical protein